MTAEADKELSDVAARWRSAGVPEAEFQPLTSRPPDPSLVLCAFAAVFNAAGTSDDLVGDFGSIVTTGLFHDTADFVPRPISGLAKFIRKTDDRKRTILEEALHLFSKFDAQPRPQSICDVAWCFLFPRYGICTPQAEHLVLMRVFELSAVDTRASFLKKVATKLISDADADSSGMARVASHIRTMCTLFDLFIRVLKPQVHGDDSAETAKVVSSLSQMLHFAVNGGPMIRNQASVLSAVREAMFPCLLRATVHPIRSVHVLGINIFVVLVGAAREKTAVEIEAFFYGAIFPILQSKLASVSHKITLLESVRGFCTEPQHLIDFFLNYDCDTDRRSIFDGLWERLIDIATTEPDTSLRLSSLSCIVSTAQAINQWMDRFEDTSRSEDLVTEDENDVSPTVGEERFPVNTGPSSNKRTLESAIEKFNHGKISEAKELLSEINDSSSQNFAAFLLNHNHLLNKTIIGEYFSKPLPDRIESLKEYVALHNFREMTLDEALREFLGGFKLVGEAQVVDRTMEIFASHYCEHNPTVFRSASTAFVLSFSLCMLNTDAHSANVLDKMSCESFIKTTKGIDDGADLPREMLMGMYDRIVGNEIKLRSGPADRPHAPDIAPSAPFMSGLPLIRHLTPVVNLVTDAIMLPIEIASSLTGYAEAAEKRRSGELFLKEFNSIVYETIAAMKFLKPQAQRAFVMANSLQHVVPLLHSCADTMVKALCFALSSDQDAEFDQGLKGARNAVQACCRIGHIAQLVQLFAKLIDLCNVFLDDSAAPIAQRHGKALRSLYEFTTSNGDALPESIWRSVFNLHCFLLSADLFADCAVSPDSSKSSWFRRAEEDPKTRAKQKAQRAREIIKATLSETAVARLFDPQSYKSSTRVNMIRSLSSVLLELLKTSKQCPLQKQLTKLLMESSTTATRLQWYQMWSASSAVYVALGTCGDITTMEDAVSSLGQLACSFLRREEIGHFNNQQDVMKPLETILLSPEAAPVRDAVLASIAEVLETRAASLCSGWKTIFSALSHSANFPSIVLGSWAVLRRGIENHSVLIRSGNLTPECTQCLIAFVCNQWSPDVASEAVSQVKKWCAASTAAEVTRSWNALLSASLSAGREILMRCSTTEILLDSVHSREEEDLSAAILEVLTPLVMRLCSSSEEASTKESAGVILFAGLVRCVPKRPFLAELICDGVRQWSTAPESSWEVPLAALHALADPESGLRRLDASYSRLAEQHHREPLDYTDSIALTDNSLGTVLKTLLSCCCQSSSNVTRAMRLASTLGGVDKAYTLRPPDAKTQARELLLAQLDNVLQWPLSAQRAALLCPMMLFRIRLGWADCNLNEAIATYIGTLLDGCDDADLLCAVFHASALQRVLGLLISIAPESIQTLRSILVTQMLRLPTHRELRQWNETAAAAGFPGVTCSPEVLGTHIAAVFQDADPRSRTTE